jgi:hypothetical protein
VTRQELINLALREMEAASWSPEKWADAIEHGYNGERYQYKKTHNWKAQKALWDAIRANPSPAPAPTIDLRPVQSVLILAEDPWGALNAPPWYQFWITADLGYRKWYADESFIAAARRQGRTIRSWADCKADRYTPGVGTGPVDAIQMVADYGLDGWAGEGERPDAFDRAVNAGARVLVVNLSALTAAQVAKIARGEVVVTVELYRNLQPNMVVDWRNAHAGIGASCIAVYGSTQEGASAYPQEQYAARGELPRGVSVYCGGSPKPDYAGLP